MRISFSRWPRVAATPAAMASASLRISTEAFNPPRPSTPHKAAANEKPLICCRFGDSSTTPLRITPGKPTPTLSICRSPAIWRTCSPISSAISSPVIVRSVSGLSASSGKTRIGPMSALSSTTPTATCRVARTPIVCPMLVLHSQRNRPGGLSYGPVLLKSRQFVQAVERGGLVTFGQGRIIENRIHEILYGPFQDHDGLADVQQLGCAFADDMHTQYLLGLPIKDQLQAACSVAADLPARDLAIIGHAHFVRNVVIGQLLFSLADKRYFRNRVDAVRIGCRVGMHRQP